MLYNDARTTTSAAGDLQHDLAAGAAPDSSPYSFRDHTPDRRIVDTVVALSRSTVWQLVDEIPLRFDAFHPQGMVRIGTSWWVSTVDIAARRGFVMVCDAEGGLLEQIPIGAGDCYHPGGMDYDGTALWIPCAEYRPDSTAQIYRLQPGSAPERIFGVDDHVGALARCGADGDLVGWSWGSRRFYRWSLDGRLVAAHVNPSFFVDHQDCQWLGGGRLLCGGVAAVQLAKGAGWLGGLGLLNVDTLAMQREVPFPFYSSVTDRVATQNPLWAEVVGDQLMLHLLPDDGVGTIQTYSTVLVADGL